VFSRRRIIYSLPFHHLHQFPDLVICIFYLFICLFAYLLKFYKLDPGLNLPGKCFKIVEAIKHGSHLATGTGVKHFPSRVHEIEENVQFGAVGVETLKQVTQHREEGRHAYKTIAAIFTGEIPAIFSWR